MRAKTLLYKIEPQNRRNLFFLFTILFLITLIFSYFPFFLFNRSLLWNTDGFLQHYETISQLRRAVSQIFSGKGFSFWSWNIGLGADTIGAMSYVFFDPFKLIAAAFPERYTDIGYTVSTLTELYAIGVAFLYFGKVRNLKLNHTLWGALAFSFSTWIIIASCRHSFFLTAALLFICLMVGIEKILRHQSPFVFIFSTVMAVITSVYFAYMTALVLLLYLIIHYIKYEPKTFTNIIRFWGFFILYVGVALLISSPIVFPSVYTITHGVIEGASDLSLLHDFSSYLAFFVSFIGGNLIFEQYSTIAVTPLLTILLPTIFNEIKRKRHTSSMIMFLFCLVFLLFPIFDSLFNGLSYPVGRWCYSATFFFILSGLECLEMPDFNIDAYKKRILLGLGIVGILLIFWGRIILNTFSEMIVLIGLINIAFAIIFLRLLNSGYPKRYAYSGMITLAIICNIVMINNIRFFPGPSSWLYDFAENGLIYNKLDHSTQKAGTEIKDDDFYRIDQVDYISTAEFPDKYTNSSYRPAHTPPNETMVFNTRSLYTYLSSISNSIFDLNQVINNSPSYYQRISTYGNDNRCRMDFLMGTKYFLGNNPYNYPSLNAESYASYGFKKSAVSSDGVEILKAKYSLGLGCVFKSYITEKEFLKLDYVDREQALMECVIIPDDVSVPMMHKNNSTKISAKSKDVPYEVTWSDGISVKEEPIENKRPILNQKGSLKIEKENAALVLSLREKCTNCDLYLTIRNMKRVPSDKNFLYKTDKLKEFRNILNGTSEADSKEIVVDATMGEVTKRAINSIGDIRGFADIKDLTLNLGEYNRDINNIKLSFLKEGTYSYDSIQVIAVPHSTYEMSAKLCMKNSYKIKCFSDNNISGRIKTEGDVSMLYLSIPYHDGWIAYVDGKETPVQKVDIAFSGVIINGAGKHTVKLHYRPYGFKLGIMLSGIGVIMLAVVLFMYHIRKRNL